MNKVQMALELRRALQIFLAGLDAQTHTEKMLQVSSVFPAWQAGRAYTAGEVLRYEADNLHALNFVAHGALGGGVSRSLSVDNYGKALSAAILGFELLVPAVLAPLLRRRAPG